MRFLELAELDGQFSYLGDLLSDKHLPDETSDELIDGLKALLKRVQDRRKSVLKALSPQQGNEGSVTRILKDATAVINGCRENAPWLTHAYLSEWRSASGAAHARMWHADIRPHESVPLIGQGKKIRISRATLETYGTSSGAATMATSEAFRLWDLHAH